MRIRIQAFSSRFTARALTLLATVALVGLTALSATAQDPARTVTSACSKCHDTKRVCANLGVKDAAAWNVTVTRMMGKGAQVSEAEKADVVGWLAAQQPGAKPVCP